MVYTIGEMSKLLGINTSTLRYYEQEGLLPFVERTSGGVRKFSDRDYEWLKVIECLKKSGLTIKEIRSYLNMVQEGDSSLKNRLDLFEKRRKAVLEQIDDLNKMLSILDYKCWYYEKALSDGTEKIVRNINFESIPEDKKSGKRILNLSI